MRSKHKHTILRSEKGVAIVEVMVAVSILVIVMYMLVGLQVDYFKRFHDISNQTSALSGLRSMEEDIMKDEKFLIPQTGIVALEEDVVADDALEKSFGALSTAKTDQRCYTQQGFRLNDLTDPGCFYILTYYKMAVKDRRFKNDAVFASIPMSRVNIRVRYYDVDDTDRSNPKRVERNIYLSKLVTNAISY